MRILKTLNIPVPTRSHSLALSFIPTDEHYRQLLKSTAGHFFPGASFSAAERSDARNSDRTWLFSKNADLHLPALCRSNSKKHLHHIERSFVQLIFPVQTLDCALPTRPFLGGQTAGFSIEYGELEQSYLAFSNARDVT
ncbi:hypothetical protein ABLO27_18365 [Roseibium sp. SCPC15]|uniref:hypothetical protein n=1 Tax=Roseibium sp. SCP15 TaxID=3141376 RepID=UPI0033363177